MQNQLHPGAKWLFRIRAYISMIFLMIFIGWFLFIPLGFILRLIFGQDIQAAIIIAVVIFIVYVAIVIIVAEIYTRMAYNRWFYEFTDSNLKIERGIIWKRYSNIPYERVQNVDIQRGIIARILGFSSVMIQTAGFSYSPNNRGWAEGYIPAVSMESAEKIREFLMKRLSKRSHQGL